MLKFGMQTTEGAGGHFHSKYVTEFDKKGFHTHPRL